MMKGRRKTKVYGAAFSTVKYQPIFTILQVPGEIAPGIPGFPRRINDDFVEVSPGMFEYRPAVGVPSVIPPGSDPPLSSSGGIMGLVTNPLVLGGVGVAAIAAYFLMRGAE